MGKKNFLTQEILIILLPFRRGARAVERGGLENRCAGNCTEGSNPSLSAFAPTFVGATADAVRRNPTRRRAKFWATMHSFVYLMKLSLAKIISLFTLTINYTFGQQNVVGRVLDFDTKKPIKEAIVTIEGTTTSTKTNIAGFFQLAVDTTNSLTIICQGYDAGKIKIPGFSNFQIRLKKNKATKITQVNSDFEKGITQNGLKIGVWEYYNKPGELSLKFDYNSNRVLFIAKDTSRYTIEINGIWTQSTLDIQPRYIGSDYEYYWLFGSNIRYPAEARRNSTAGTFYVTFEVDTMGRADNFKVINDIGDKCGDESIKSLKLIPNLWIVASRENVKYKSRFILPITFKLKSNGKEYGRPHRKNSNEAELPIAWKLNEAVIIGSTN